MLIKEMTDAYELGSMIGSRLRLERGQKPGNLPTLIRKETP